MILGLEGVFSSFSICLSALEFTLVIQGAEKKKGRKLKVYMYTVIWGERSTE